MMSLPTRLWLLIGFSAWAGLGSAATTTTKSKSSGSSSKSKSTTTAKSKSGTSKADTESKAKSKDDASSAKPDTPAEKKAEAAVPKEDTPKAPRPAAVSSIRIEELTGFDQYPKQVQSLVQSCLALTHLELRYMYGSHEPSNGGMDCSGTIYHVLHFQGLKDVPRQSDEMALWVDRKSWLHLTPTATDFDSPEFKDLKPGDLLFWTNTTATTRKLPVTHVMIYLGKQKDGKRVIFGASDGRSFSGQRRSGVSVFDFHLPRAEGTARLHGYGPAPGILPQDVILAAKEAAAAAAAAAAPATTPVVEEEPVKKETAKEPEVAAKTTPAPMSGVAKPKEEPLKETVAVVTPPKTETLPTKPQSPASTPSTPASKPAETQEEVRRAVTVSVDAPKETEPTTAEEETPTKAQTEVAKADEPVKKANPTAKPKSSSSSTAKAKTGTSSKKRTTAVSSRRRAPAPPPKSSVERAVDNAVSSVKRIFR